MEDLENVSASEIILDAHVQLFDKITTKEIDKALIMSAREKIEKEPNYSYAASRLLLATLHKEVFKESRDKDGFDHQYRLCFIKNVKKLVSEEILDERLLSFDLLKLSEAIKPSRDLKFKYLGLQIVKDRYLHRVDDHIMETPQAFWMRVHGLAIEEKIKMKRLLNFTTRFLSFVCVLTLPCLIVVALTVSFPVVIFVLF